jgi:glyoxylase-like metal-dependent hydrolase (beta-lactamase superfamily II)
MRFGAFLDTLAAVGTKPEDIDVLALTHTHVDHTGWTFLPSADGPRPTFPNARYLLAAAEWAPHGRREQVKGAPDVDRVLAPLGQVAEQFDDGAEIAPGIVAIVTPGHSAGHTSYLITSAAGRRVLAFGDAFHIPAQLAHLDWLSAPDVDPTGVIAGRSRLLTELDRPDTIGFGIHFGDQPFGRLSRDAEDQLTWTPVASEAVLPAPSVQLQETQVRYAGTSDGSGTAVKLADPPIR